MALLRSVRHLRRSISTLSPNLRINVSSDGLVLSSQNTSSNLLTFPWLRDACQCSHCIHPSTRQKLFHTTEVDPNITPAKVEVDPDSNLVNVNWNDGHNSHFSYEFLQRNSNPSSLSTFNRDVAARPWSISSLVGESGQNLFNSYQDLTSSPSSLLAAIRQLCTYGILFVTDVPASETDDQNCELPKLANLFGEIRETFYGRVWDVRSVANSKNIAYTDLNLGLHMDLL
jgi:gamma-butyrobetaine dioxygenase